MSGDSPNETSGPPGGRLAFDETMAGLTLDEVSVVLVGDRPLLVPLSAGLAERSGFTVIEVSDESLLSLGVLPRRGPVAAVVDVISPDTPPVETFPPTPEGASQVASSGSSGEAATGTWATWPSVDGGAASAVVPGWPGQVPRTPDAAPTPTAEQGTRASSERPAPLASALSETPVETARPINAMAASHLDWEPGALGWPYVDRRVDAPSSHPDAAATSPAPRSLTSGRPVNNDAPIEIVLRGSEVDDSDLIIELRDVATISLAPITIGVAAMSLTVVSGPRGSGKTSLLRLLAGFDAPTQGSGLVGGERLESIHPDDRAMREAISAGFVPQMPFLVPDLTVAENVELPLLATDVSPAMARGTAEETLRMVGLGSVIGLPAAVLSGAEVRLVAVARALVSSPEIVFADEPFAGLSDDDAATVLACLHDVVADGGTVIVACTDPRAHLHGVRQLVLDRGRLSSDDVASATN